MSFYSFETMISVTNLHTNGNCRKYVNKFWKNIRNRPWFDEYSCSMKYVDSGEDIISLALYINYGNLSTVLEDLQENGIHINGYDLVFTMGEQPDTRLWKSGQDWHQDDAQWES